MSFQARSCSYYDGDDDGESPISFSRLDSIELIEGSNTEGLVERICDIIRGTPSLRSTTITVTDQTALTPIDPHYNLTILQLVICDWSQIVSRDFSELLGFLLPLKHLTIASRFHVEGFDI